VLGTPCNPFSRQSTKRFQTGGVKNHALYQHTFTDVFQVLDNFHPPTVTMEQSSGFDLPYSKDDSTTPLSKLLWLTMYMKDFNLCMAVFPKLSSFHCAVHLL